MLTPEDVKKVSKLAKFNLSDQEVEKFQKLLSEALDYTENLNELDTNTVNPTSHVSGLVNVFNEDETRPSLTNDQVLQNAPKKKKGYIVTDAVLEKHKK